MGDATEHKQLFIRIGIIVGVGIFLLISIIAYQRNGKAFVEIQTLPQDSNITLNGTRVSAHQSYIEPGTYSVVVEKEGFAPKSQTITVGTSNPTTINFALVPITDDAKKWVKDHESEYANFNKTQQATLSTNEEKLKQSNPITKKLPYKNLLYEITYSADTTDPDGKRIILKINADDTYKEAALFQIKKWGFDPTDFVIEYSGYNNPITS